MVDVTYEDYQDLVRKLSLANERVRDLQERVSGRDAHIAALEAQLAEVRRKIQERADWHKCSCPHPCDDYNVFPGGCSGKYRQDYISILSAIEATPPAPKVTEEEVEAALKAFHSVGRYASEKARMKAALTAAGFRIVGPGEDQTPERHVLASLTLAHVDFLERVRDGEPLPITSRQDDRVRQFCRRNGLAEMASKPRRWVLTSAGEAALRTLKEKQG